MRSRSSSTLDVRSADDKKLGGSSEIFKRFGEDLIASFVVVVLDTVVQLLKTIVQSVGGICRRLMFQSPLELINVGRFVRPAGLITNQVKHLPPHRDIAANRLSQLLHQAAHGTEKLRIVSAEPRCMSDCPVIGKRVLQCRGRKCRILGHPLAGKQTLEGGMTKPDSVIVFNQDPAGDQIIKYVTGGRRIAPAPHPEVPGEVLLRIEPGHPCAVFLYKMSRKPTQEVLSTTEVHRKPIDSLLHSQQERHVRIEQGALVKSLRVGLALQHGD